MLHILGPCLPLSFVSQPTQAALGSLKITVSTLRLQSGKVTWKITLSLQVICVPLRFKRNPMKFTGSLLRCGLERKKITENENIFLKKFTRCVIRRQCSSLTAILDNFPKWTYQKKQNEREIPVQQPTLEWFLLIWALQPLNLCVVL